jgi:WD40 repeat protein
MPFPERSSYLRMYSLQAGLAELGKQIFELDLQAPWSVEWLRWAAPERNYSVAQLSSYVSALAVGNLNAQPVVLAGDDDGILGVWNLGTGRPVWQIDSGHSGAVWAVAVADLDGRSVGISGGDDGLVRVWDLNTGRLLRQPFAGHEPGLGPDRDRTIFGVAFTQIYGLPVAVTAGADGTVRIWNLRTGSPIGQPLVGHGLGLERDGKAVFGVAVAKLHGLPVAVTAGADDTLRIWDLCAGVPVGQPLEGHGLGPFRGVRAIATGEISDHPIAVSGGVDATVRVWDLVNGEAIGHPMTGHGTSLLEGIYGVCVGTVNDQPIAVSCGADSTIRMWDLRTMTSIGKPINMHDGWVRSVALGQMEGRQVIVSGGADKTVRVMSVEAAMFSARVADVDVSTLRPMILAEIEGRPVVISGDNKGTVRIWDLNNGNLLGSPFAVEPPVCAIASGYVDGCPVMAVADHETIHLWNLRTGLASGLIIRGHQRGKYGHAIFGLAVRELDGRPIILSAGWDDVIRIWDGRTGALVGELVGHDSGTYGGVRAVATTDMHDRPIVVSGGADDTVRVWDLRTARPIGRPLEGHCNGVYSLALGQLAGRQIIVSGGSDGTVRLWDLRSGTAMGGPLYRHGEGSHGRRVFTVAVRQSGAHATVASGGGDGTLHMWNENGKDTTIEMESAVYATAFTPNGSVVVSTRYGLLAISFAPLLESDHPDTLARQPRPLAGEGKGSGRRPR